MKVEITSEELKELQKAHAKLVALENAGVDNWDGYGEALDEIRKEEEREEKLEQLMEDIEIALSEGAYEPSEIGAGFTFSQESSLKAFQILKKGISNL